MNYDETIDNIIRKLIIFFFSKKFESKIMCITILFVGSYNIALYDIMLCDHSVY